MSIEEVLDSIPLPEDPTLETIIPKLNESFLSLVDEVVEKFKYHEELAGQLEEDHKYIHHKLEENPYAVLNSFTHNFLFCLEQVVEHNVDFFLYQKEKVHRKNSGKTIKNKITKWVSTIPLKNILSESDSGFIDHFFRQITDMFMMFVVSEEGNLKFIEEYINYVHENFSKNKNYSKMIMVLDNTNEILNQPAYEEEVEEVDFIEAKPSKDEKKKKKNKKQSGNPLESMMNPEFLSNLENSKIGQIAKNISEKLNPADFQQFMDPTKIMQSLSNPEGEDSGGLQNLLKMVIGEVEGAFKSNTLNEGELIQEAQNMMGALKENSGIDPMSLFGGAPDMKAFEKIFQGKK